MSIIMNIAPKNFRKVSLDSVSKNNSNLYRSNEIDEANYELAQWLRETIGINSHIDLRVKEGKNQYNAANPYFVDRDIDEIYWNSNDCHKGSIYYPEFLTAAHILRIMFYQMRWKEKWILLLLLIRHLFYRDFGYKKYLFKYILQSSSMKEIYCMLIDDYQDILKKIFLLMLNPNNFPMLISCNYGKDRTGIVVALLMELIGCSDDVIIGEYSKSENLLKPIKSKMLEFMNALNLSESVIISPPEFMAFFLKHLRKKYGNAEGYLRTCGVTPEQIKRIKRNILNQ